MIVCKKRRPQLQIRECAKVCVVLKTSFNEQEDVAGDVDVADSAGRFGSCCLIALSNMKLSGVDNISLQPK